MVGIGLLEIIEKISTSLSKRVLTGLLPEVHGVFLIAFGCWLLWWLMMSGVLEGRVERKELVRILLGFVLVETFLVSGSLYHEWLFEPLRSLGFRFTEVMIRGGSMSGSITNVRGLLTTLDAEMKDVLKMALAIGQDGSAWNFTGWLAGTGGYFFSWFFWFLFFVALVEYQFCFTVFACLSPLAIALAFFKATQPLSRDIFRLPLFAGLVMGISSLAMSFVFEVLRFASKHGVIQDGKILPSASEYVCSASFMELVVGLLVGSFMLMKAHGIAGKIAGFELSIGANAAFAAAAAYTKTGAIVGGRSVATGIGTAYGSYRAGNGAGPALRDGGAAMVHFLQRQVRGL